MNIETTKKFKVGDKAIITGRNTHWFKIGEEVVIQRVNSSSYKCSNGNDFWFVDESELKSIED